ncbi:hypothetical protein D3C72_2351280 [compost metagenome]
MRINARLVAEPLKLVVSRDAVHGHIQTVLFFLRRHAQTNRLLDQLREAEAHGESPYDDNSDAECLYAQQMQTACRQKAFLLVEQADR